MMKDARWLQLWELRRYDVAAISLVVLFFIIFFWPVISSGNFFLTGDGFVYSYPLRTIAWSRIRDGHLPLWTSLIFSGYPLLSMAQIGIGYPLTWGYLFLPGPVAEHIYLLAPYVLFPSFIYGYAREIGRSRTGSLLAALAFSYSGITISAIAHNGMLTNALMWLPLMLIILERARRKSFSLCLVIAASIYAMSVLSGIGQGFILTGLVAIAYAVFLTLVETSPGTVIAARSWKRWRRWRPLAVASGGMIIAAGVSAFQILETLRAHRRSIRSHLSYTEFSEGSYSPIELLASLIDPLDYIADASAYVTPLALLLAVIGVVAFWSGPKRDPRVRFWSVVVLAGLILALGNHTAVYRLAYSVPILNLFRVPGRHAFELAFGVSILSAYGWDALRSKLASHIGKNSAVSSERRQILIVLLLLAVSVTVVLLWHRAVPNIPSTHQYFWDVRDKFPVSHYVWFKTLLLIATLALFWVGARLTSARWRAVSLISVIVLSCYAEPSVKAARWWWPRLKSSSQLASESATTRILRTYPPEQNRIYTRTALFAEELRQPRRFEPVNLTMLHGLQNLAGYEPLILERYSRALGNAFIDGVSPRPGHPLDNSLMESKSHVLDILNTSFVVSYSDLSLEPKESVDPPTYDPNKWELFYSEDQVILLRNKSAMPRLWLVTTAEAVDGEEALQRIRGEGKAFDPKTTALLEIDKENLPLLPGGSAPPNALARIVAYDDNQLVIETSADTATVLVLSEINYPGWVAKIDGVVSPIHSANFLLRSVVLSAGVHRVEMSYTAPAARNGGYISVFSLLLLGGILVYSRVRGGTSKRHKTSV